MLEVLAGGDRAGGVEGFQEGPLSKWPVQTTGIVRSRASLHADLPTARHVLALIAG